MRRTLELQWNCQCNYRSLLAAMISLIYSFGSEKSNAAMAKRIPDMDQYMHKYLCSTEEENNIYPLVNQFNFSQWLGVVYAITFFSVAGLIVYRVWQFPWQLLEDEERLTEEEHKWSDKIQQWRERRDVRRRERLRVHNLKFAWKQEFDSQWPSHQKKPFQYYRIHQQTGKPVKLPKMKVGPSGKELLLGDENERRAREEEKRRARNAMRPKGTQAQKQAQAEKLKLGMTSVLGKFYKTFWRSADHESKPAPCDDESDDESERHKLALADISDPEDEILDKFDDHFFDMLELPRRRGAIVDPQEKLDFHLFSKSEIKTPEQEKPNDAESATSEQSSTVSLE